MNKYKKVIVSILVMTCFLVSSISSAFAACPRVENWVDLIDHYNDQKLEILDQKTKCNNDLFELNQKRGDLQMEIWKLTALITGYLLVGDVENVLMAMADKQIAESELTKVNNNIAVKKESLKEYDKQYEQAEKEIQYLRDQINNHSPATCWAC